jgi:hypothetical protein
MLTERYLICLLTRGRLAGDRSGMAKRPRSMADLADRLCDAVKHLAAERSSRRHGAQWIMLHDVARHLGISDDEAQRAVALAVERGWLTTDGSGSPHSVSLIWGGGEA